MKKLLLILVFIPALLFSQTRKQRKAIAAQQKADQVILTDFKNHSQNLANYNSTPDAKDNSLLIEYISNQFKVIGLQQKGENGYIQSFKIDAGKHIKPSTFLKVNGSLLAVKKDYFPLPYSAEKSLTGMPAMALREKGVPWFADVKDWVEDNAPDHVTDIDKRVQKEAQRAAAKGSTALFLYNSSNTADNIRYNNKDKTPPLPIPVIYITAEGFKKYFNDQSQILDIELNVAFEKLIKNYNNIAGYIDNGAASNIIIAAPYDNLYVDEYQTAVANQKVNDTVDAVGGTSMLIELAKMLRSSKAKNNNYTFIAYSGESVMLQSSKWINSTTVTSPANYIINLNSVGRYDDNKKLLIEGYGTSANFLETLKPLAGKTLEVTVDSSFAGRDTSVHYAKVPVLSFFTGGPATAASGNINYEGELHIAKFIYSLIEATNTKGKLDFAKNN